MARVTVLFATLNGAHTLPRMLDTLERLKPPAGGWKVVAVDNGSTDDTLHILEQRAANLPMRVISEPRRGKNVGLNAGLAFVEGDIVALTDDDVILPADWLVEIERVGAQQPDYDIFGGAIVPVWEESPPAWLLRCAPQGLWALTDFPEGPVGASCVWGPSMAVRTAVFRDHNFAEGIGPDGSMFYVMGSETEFTARAESSGHRCWHFRASPVGHIIRPHQLKPEWILQRRYNLGRGICRKRHTNDEEAPFHFFGYPRRHVLGLIYSARYVTTAATKVAIARFFGDFEDQFKATMQLRYCQGDLAERLAIIRAQPMLTRNGRPNC